MSQAAPEKKKEEQAAPSTASVAKPALGTKKGDIVLRAGARPATSEYVAALSEEEIQRRYREAFRAHGKFESIFVGGGILLGVATFFGGMMVGSFAIATVGLPVMIGGSLVAYVSPAAKKRLARVRDWRKLIAQRHEVHFEKATEEYHLRKAALAKVRLLVEGLSDEEKSDPKIAEITKLLAEGGVLPKNEARPLPGRRKPEENTP